MNRTKSDAFEIYASGTLLVNGFEFNLAVDQSCQRTSYALELIIKRRNRVNRHFASDEEQDCVKILSCYRGGKCKLLQGP